MRRRILNNWWLKLLSILGAIVAWIAIVNYDNPNTTRVITGIPIDVVGAETLTENNQIYQVVGTQTASVRVRCPRRLAQSLKVADFRATADFSRLYTPTSRIPVVVTSVNSRVLDSYLTQITQSLEVTIESIGSRKMDVNVVTTGEPTEGYQVGIVRPSPSVVTVQAPESILDQIGSVGVAVSVDTLSQDATQHAKLIYYNAGGNIMDTTGMDNLKASSTDIIVAVQILNVKNVGISASVTGVEDTAKGYRYTGMEITPETVKISGRKNVLDEITSLALSVGELDVTGASESLVNTYQLSDLQLPENVKLVDSQEQEISVQLKVEKLETKTFELDLSRVTLENLDEELVILNEDAKLSVTVEGLSSDLNALEASEITAKADLSGLTAGTHNITAEAEVPEEFSVVGTAALRLQLVDKTTAAEEGIAPAEQGGAATEPLENLRAHALQPEEEKEGEVDLEGETESEAKAEPDGEVHAVESGEASRADDETEQPSAKSADSGENPH